LDSLHLTLYQSQILHLYQLPNITKLQGVVTPVCTILKTVTGSQSVTVQKTVHDHVTTVKLWVTHTTFFSRTRGNTVSHTYIWS